MRMKNVPSVTMKLGSDVFSTRVPLNHPYGQSRGQRQGAPRCAVPARRGDVAGQQDEDDGRAPVMAPEERSNSPPIINSATGTAIRPR